MIPGYKIEGWRGDDRRSWKYLKEYTPGDIEWPGASWMTNKIRDPEEFIYDSGIFQMKFSASNTLTLCIRESEFSFIPYKENQLFDFFKIRWYRTDQAHNEGDTDFWKSIVFHHVSVIRIDFHNFKKAGVESFYNVYLRVLAGVDYPNEN